MSLKELSGGNRNSTIHTLVLGKRIPGVGRVNWINCDL